jgi:Ca2+-dependent lipid-binding protein
VIIAGLEIMSVVQVSQKSFYLRVYDYDMLSKNDPLGEIVVPLWQVDLSQPFEDWKDLGKMTAKPREAKPSRKKSSSSSDDDKRKSKPSAGPASLCYSLHYEQTSQTLVATVMQCRNLKNADLLGGKPDAVVNVSLGDKEQKTKVVKGNNNPEINQTFRFPLPVVERTRHTLYFQVELGSLL